MINVLYSVERVSELEYNGLLTYDAPSQSGYTSHVVARLIHICESNPQNELQSFEQLIIQTES